MSTKPSSDLKESTIECLRNTISASESPTYTKPNQAKRTKDLEYIQSDIDNMGTH